MKELINYCELPHGHNPKPLLDINAYLQAENLNGIELMLYKNDALPCNSLDKILGIHLKYWPFWMDFWNNNTEALKMQFACQQDLISYFGNATSTEAWLAYIKDHIGAALALNPEYLVWHVANADYQEAFTLNFRYSDAEVLACTTELFNSIAEIIPATTLVLFENLWWPGLRLTNKEQVDSFLAQINHPHTGIMLDLGHLLNTNCELQNEVEAYAYALSVLEQLGETCKQIKGVHLSCSLSGYYVKSFEKKFPNNTPIFKHITQIDQHRPCQNSELKKIINLIQPQYLVHELYYNDFQELSSLLKIQRNAFK